MEAVAEITAAVKNVPALRFPEFEGEWEEIKFEDFCTLQRGFDLTNATRIEGEVPVYSSSGLSYYHNVAKVKAPGVVTGRKGIVGKVFFIKEDFWPHDTTLWVKNFNSNDEKFVYWFLLRFRLERFDASTSVPTLNRNNVHGIKIHCPLLPEQQKIASFLTAADDKIQQLSKKKALLEKYKKGVMQQIFSQQIRFKDNNGRDFPEWKEKRLKEVAKEIKRTASSDMDIEELDVLTISAGTGFISQKERFSQVIAGQSLAKYTLLKEGELSYNRGASKRFQFGCIYTLKSYQKALVPNIYISFSFEKSCVAEFYNQLFSTGFANRQLRKFISSSARLDGLLNINKNDFFSIRIPVPSLAEQSKVASFLLSIDNKINCTSTQLEQAQQFKKGLLQQMFV